MLLSEIVEKVYSLPLLTKDEEIELSEDEIRIGENKIIVGDKYYKLTFEEEGIKAEKRNIFLTDERIKFHIDDSVNHYEEVNLKIIDKILKKNNFYNSAVGKIKIENGIIKERKTNREDFALRRFNKIIRILEKCIEYYSEFDIKIDDTEIYIILQDIYNFFYDDVPFWSMSAPVNKKRLLYPFDIFIDNDLKEEGGLNFDQIRAKVEERRLIQPSKINAIYFRGNDTDLKFGGLRKFLGKSKIKGVPLQVEITTHNKDVWEFQDYKYLLDIGGNQPWSYRFPYLFLMKSLVIKIDTVKRNRGEFDLEWTSLFGYNLEEGIDYISIKFIYIEGDEENNQKERQRVLREIKWWYRFFERNPDKYIEMVENGYKKCLSFDMEKIYQCLYYTILKYNSLHVIR